jgi:hypothetical protein
LSDNTRVCAYMYKTVEHLSIHNADDDESSEDYGAADVQVIIIWQYCSMGKVLEHLKGLHPYCYSMTEKFCVLWHVINKLTSCGYTSV